MVDGIVKSFSALSDPRRPGRAQHKLIGILIIAVSAVIAGAVTGLARDSQYLGDRNHPQHRASL
jgi:hypothetical protein